MSQKHPTSPLKSQPQPKRPNSSQGDPLITRGQVNTSRNTSNDNGASSTSIPLNVRVIGNIQLVPLEKFSGKQVPTNAEVLRRLYWLRDQSNTTSWSHIYNQVFDLRMNHIYYPILEIQCVVSYF